MQELKFRLRCSKTKNIIGFERLNLDGWEFQYYDFDWQPGTFHQSLLGDGYLGIVQREQFVGRRTEDGVEIYVGDELQLPEDRYEDCQHGDIGIVVWDDTHCDFSIEYKSKKRGAGTYKQSFGMRNFDMVRVL